jgi:hypothetical protein
MCQYEFKKYRYRNCTLLQNGFVSSGQPHEITTKYIHKCESCSEDCCPEESQIRRIDAGGDSPHSYTWVTGGCPACKATEQAQHEVFIVCYIHDLTYTSTTFPIVLSTIRYLIRMHTFLRQRLLILRSTKMHQPLAQLSLWSHLH